MYKSVNLRDSSEIVILDSKWRGAIDNLRALDQQDVLVCPGCHQPVRVRAGVTRQPHFAHKHLANCSYDDGSLELHEARAALYEWLIGKFIDGVTIEKKIDGEYFCRPVDCWVEKGSVVYAYWIFDAALKSEKRKQIKIGFEKLGVNVIYVFTIDMLEKYKGHPNCLLLTTTERDFLQRSIYDNVAYALLTEGQTLHYLDAGNHMLHTFRGLHKIHEPQVYEGRHHVADLSKLLVSPQNGEFVHREEYEQQQRQAEIKALQKQGQQANGPQNQCYPAPQKQGLHLPDAKQAPFPGSLSRQEGMTPEPAKPGNDSAISAKEDKMPSSIPLNKEGTCVFCGAVTTDWWEYESATGRCKCRNCYREGKY